MTSAKGKHVEIPSVALDDFFRDLQLQRWDAMKLDAEGSELAVLRGAQSLLEKYRPAVVMEINNVSFEQGGFSPSGPADFLLKRGYRLSSLSFDGWSRTNIRNFAMHFACLANARPKC